MHTHTSYHATLLHPLSLATAFQLNVGVVSFVGVVAATNVGLFGQLLSTCIVRLGHVAAFPLLLVSFTAFAFNVNHVVPFTLATHVYVNVYVLLVAVPATVLLFHNISQLLLYCTLLALTLVWLIHTQSVHVNVTVHATHHAIHLLLGVHQLHSGLVVSLHVPVYIVLELNDTLVHGSKFPFHFGVEYHTLALHVIDGNVLLQLVALFCILHHVLFSHIPDTHTHDLYVAVTSLYVIA